MTRDQIVAAITATGIVPCWRYDDTSAIIDASKALCDGGMTTVELTMTMPGNLKLIERAVAELPAGVVVGAGTVLDAETARMAILAGARYVVSPCLVPELVPMCHRYGVAVVLGAASPTELMEAKALGSDVIKIFPAGIGGPSHVAEMISVFPGVRTVVTGSTVLADIPGYMAAGADAAVVGLPHMALAAYKERRFDDMRRMGERLMALVREGRDPAAKKRLGEEYLARYTDIDRGAKSARAVR
jgi:2-dehydro-3-deoxyphosphogluconate aldolase/(4S)-4-hydroxy-2-oxoglutarate aldolase